MKLNSEGANRGHQSNHELLIADKQTYNYQAARAASRLMNSNLQPRYSNPLQLRSPREFKAPESESESEDNVKRPKKKQTVFHQAPITPFSRGWTKDGRW